MAEATKVAYVFPGQGSQRVGMGRDIYEKFEVSRVVFDKADAVLGFPLSRLCFEGPEEDLRQTINAQPALVTVSIACLKAAQSVYAERMPPPSFVAGHSLGEYTALIAAGALDFATGVNLARERGRLMHEAGQTRPGGMTAIIGLDETVVNEICKQSGTSLANINCPGQLVISGASENIAGAIKLVEARKGRAIPLQVSGAFHSPLMQPAVRGMSPIVDNLSLANPVVPVIANTTAQPLTNASQIKEELIKQLTSAVQWQRSVEYIADSGVSTFIEIGAGKVLTGLIKRINKNAVTSNIGDVNEIAGFIKR